MNVASKAGSPLQSEYGIGEQLAAVFRHASASQVQVADRTGLSRQAIAKALEGNGNTRVSTLDLILDALGYSLVAVPKGYKAEVIAFINNGARVASLPAGTVAPLGMAQQAYADHVAMGKEFGK
ncbi:helix-turn-helix domain-containing protein [Roseateles sp. DC23W]|uniref:Helix-turn-helix domain-containing protein n=1 Tax=Pelomonas dachongensis TaxID=3299029 RepID=A0ABW7EYC7_9BURK